MNTLVLPGCTPVPLAHYLKALGILRLVSEQKDPAAKGRWHRDQFILESNVDRDGLLKFFLEDYRPTAIIAPWNGGSGFHPKDNSKALEAVLSSGIPRLETYAAAIRAAKSVLQRMELGEKPTPEQKARLLLLCRNTLPEEALAWLDAAYVLTDDGAKYPPLLGTGGNDGRLEFTNNFMQRLTEVMDTGTGAPLEQSSRQLAVSLFAESAAVSLAKAPVGQFLPGTAGGANATSGFDAASAVNPWDFILMMEGALLFASANVKRLESTDSGTLAYPFCVRQAGVGYASAADSDESASRAEMWMPVWTQRSVTLPEITAIFSEGRAQVGDRAARNGVDFARAVASLGVDRGLDEFQRYGFQVRNGLSYFATPLTRIKSGKNPGIDLLSGIDHWLDRFRRAAIKDTAPASVGRALNNLESRIFDLSINYTPERVLGVFTALGQCQKAASNSLKWAKESFLHPLQGLGKKWLAECPPSVELNLAASLASVFGKFGKELLPLRCHLEPVDCRFNKEKNRDVFHWQEIRSNHVQWSEAAFPRVLNDIFARRMILNEEGGKRFEEWASLSDIKAFIEKEAQDDLLSDLLWSMSLINWRDETAWRRPVTQSEPLPPAFYSLLKLCFPPVHKPYPDGVVPVPIVPAIHRQAATGNGPQAAGMAIRRLKASGYRPLLNQLPVQADYARRTAAALLFPVSDRTLKALAIQTNRPRDQDRASIHQPELLSDTLQSTTQAHDL